MKALYKQTYQRHYIEIWWHKIKWKKIAAKTAQFFLSLLSLFAHNEKTSASWNEIETKAHKEIF